MKEINDTLQKAIVFQSSLFDYRKGSITNKDGIEIFMEPRLKTLFYFLLIYKNDFVEKEKLMAFVWKDIIVSEQSVTKAISDLRRFLKTNNIYNLRIVTMSKLGYKLEILEETKPTILKKALKISAYTMGIVLVLITIIRALRYEQ